MKYYSYSVKDILTEYFGADPLAVMRKKSQTSLGPEHSKHLIPLSWQYADEQIMHLFLDHKFLIRTIIEDDYIVYLYQEGSRQCALLLFITDEDKGPFSINTNYACEIIQKWENAGYKTKIVSHTVAIERYGQTKNFRLLHHSGTGKGAYIYTLAENNGTPLLVYDIHGCWPEYYKKIIAVSASKDIREYKCLFEPTVRITTGQEKQKETIATGIEAVAEFFKENFSVGVYYQEFKSTGIYNRVLIAGEKGIDIWVNVRNLITEINVYDLDAAPVMKWDIGKQTQSLVDQVPALQSVRALDITQMHGYAVQMTYADGTIRNYYLTNFESRKIPDTVEIDGCIFDEQILKSVSIKGNGIRFDNGYVIAAHILYYRSYRQVQAKGAGSKGYKDILKPQYMLPLREFKSHFQTQHFWGNPGECYGPRDAMLSPGGQRITDISFSGYGFDKWCGSKAWRVCVEPTDLYGFILEDGSWLAPPVYETAEHFEGGCVKAKRKVNGVYKQFLLMPDGGEIPFEHDIDTRRFDGGLCPYNASKTPVTAPYPGYYWDHDYDDVTAGKWGYIDIHGKIVVKPQYVYAVGFYNGGGERAVVAKLIDGKLYWGAIDRTGKEVIPCTYESLYTRWGDAFAFRRYGEKMYGVMDLDGNIIAQPQFEFFEAYDEKHQLLTVGEDEDTLGVYSLELKKMIIPAEYDCIDYDDHIISCEIKYTAKERYFNYAAEELDFSQYDSVSEYEGLLRTWKDQKCGFIELDGTVVIPNILQGGLSSDCLMLYRKGYVISGEYQKLGVSTLDGRIVVPEEYTEIAARDNFIIASNRISGNWCICDTLYAYDGTPILSGPYRKMLYHSDSRQLTAETPYGIEHFQVIGGEQDGT
jgi:hypothetical protein